MKVRTIGQSNARDESSRVMYKEMNITSDLVTFEQHQLTSNEHCSTNQEHNTSELVNKQKLSLAPRIYPRMPRSLTYLWAQQTNFRLAFITEIFYLIKFFTDIRMK